eukprot:jgi/Botrbrau1/11849/Bobra.0175s0011.1
MDVPDAKRPKETHNCPVCLKVVEGTRRTYRKDLTRCLPAAAAHTNTRQKRDVEDGETRDAASLASAPCAEVLQIDRSHPLPDERFPELTGDLPDGSTSAEDSRRASILNEEEIGIATGAAGADLEGGQHGGVLPRVENDRCDDIQSAFSDCQVVFGTSGTQVRVGLAMDCPT